MAFDRGYVARQEIQAKSILGGDLYDFLDEKPPEKPKGLARAKSLPPGARNLRSNRLEDRPPAPLGTDADTLEGPLIQPPLVDLYVFLGEAPPPQNAVRRRDLDLRRAWAEVWWRFRSRRRMEQNQQDESYGPSCDYQQLSEGPAGSMATQSTANSFRDFWLSLGGGPLSIDTLGSDPSRQARRGTDPGRPRGRPEAQVAGIAQRSRSVFEPRASDRYHQLDDGPRRQERSEDDLHWAEDDRLYWDPAPTDLEVLARMGDVPNLGFGPFTMY